MKTLFTIVNSRSLLYATVILAAASLRAQSPDTGKNQSHLSKSGTEAVSAVPSLGGTLPARTDPSGMVAGFFSELELGRVNNAYDELLRGSKIADVPRDVNTLKSKTQEAIDNFGDIIGYDLVKTQPVGSHLLSQTYISTGKNYPIRWRFYFYKATDTWKLIDIRIDDRLMDMFEEQPLPAPAQ